MFDSDKRCRILFDSESISLRTKQLAEELTKDYQNKNPLILSTLTGSVIFTSDLIRYMHIPLELDFIKVSSYGSSDVSSEVVSIQYTPTISLAGRHVIIVEDIIDTGSTLKKLKTVLENDRDNLPLSVSICCLLNKPSRRKVDIVPDYVGFTIPDIFIVGYGMDYSEKYRNLPNIVYFE